MMAIEQEIGLADLRQRASVASLSELHFGVLVAKDPGWTCSSAAPAGGGREPLRGDCGPRHDGAHPGEMLAAAHRAGRPSRSRTTDLLIAATAVEIGAALLPLDLHGFGGLESFLTVLHPDDLERP